MGTTTQPRTPDGVGCRACYWALYKCRLVFINVSSRFPRRGGGGGGGGKGGVGGGMVKMPKKSKKHENPEKGQKRGFCLLIKG
jgi:hypothetical protein